LVLFVDIMPPAGYRAANLYPSPAAKSVVRSGRQFPSLIVVPGFVAPGFVATFSRRKK